MCDIPDQTFSLSPRCESYTIRTFAIDRFKRRTMMVYTIEFNMTSKCYFRFRTAETMSSVTIHQRTTNAFMSVEMIYAKTRSWANLKILVILSARRTDGIRWSQPPDSASCKALKWEKCYLKWGLSSSLSNWEFQELFVPHW